MGGKQLPNRFKQAAEALEQPHDDRKAESR
jgi:hypothetical protein